MNQLKLDHPPISFHALPPTPQTDAATANKKNVIAIDSYLMWNEK